MAGIQLTEQRRSKLLEQLLRRQQLQPDIRSGLELALRLGGQGLRQRSANRLQEEEAARTKTQGTNQDAALAALLGQNTKSVFGTDLPQNTTIEQAMSQLPIDDPVRQAIQSQMIEQQFTQPKADRITSQQFRENDDFVTRRIVNGRPDMSPQGILARSPIDRIDRIETRDVDNFDGTPTQLGTDIKDFRDAAIGAVGAIQKGSQLLKIAKSTPEALGKPGNIARFGNSMIQTAVGLGKMLGIDVGADRDIDSFAFDGFTGNLKKVAIESTQFRAGVYGIAFAAAVAEQGTRPTDKDIQQFIDQIAGTSSDADAFAATIRQFVGGMDRKLRTTATVKGIPEKVQAQAFGALDRALEGFGENFSSEDFGDLTPQEIMELKKRRGK